MGMPTPLPCVHLDVDAGPSAVLRNTLVDRVSQALARAAPVVVSCGAGLSLNDARAALAQLDQALAPTIWRVGAGPGACVSRSATEGVAAWAASGTGPIGVDVQSAPAGLTEALLHDALSGDELVWLAKQPSREMAFARLWAAKEAMLKCFGVGLAWPLTTVKVLPISADWRLVEVTALGAAWLAHFDHRVPKIAVAVAINAGHPPPG